MKRALGLMLLTVSCVMPLSGCYSNYFVTTYTDSSEMIKTNVGREFIIALDANETTGYEWHEFYDANLLLLVSKEYQADVEAIGFVGRGGTQYYHFQGSKIGQTSITLAYKRSWENSPIEEKIFNVSIEPRINSRGGKMTTKIFNYDGFKKIEVSAAFEVVVDRGNAYSINITADDFPHIRVEKIGDTLHIGRQGIEWFAPFHQKPVASIIMPDLEGVTLSGATKGTVKNFQSTQDFVIKISGASSLEITNIKARTLYAEVTGASTLKGEISTTADAKLEVSGASKIGLTGMANDVVVKESGASRCDLINFQVRNANLEISGASNGWVNLNGRLDVNLSGASNLTWTGNPTMGDISTSGASNLHTK